MDRVERATTKYPVARFECGCSLRSGRAPFGHPSRAAVGGRKITEGWERREGREGLPDLLSVLMRRFLRLLFILVLLPILIGGMVLIVVGRPLAFEVLQRRITQKFPEVGWIRTGELAQWRDDSTRPQPVVLDARTRAEFDVSHLKGASQIDPIGPACGPWTVFPRTPRSWSIPRLAIGEHG